MESGYVDQVNSLASLLSLDGHRLKLRIQQRRHWRDCKSSKPLLRCLILVYQRSMAMSSLTAFMPIRNCTVCH
jgi:hypothetical protein